MVQGGRSGDVCGGGGWCGWDATGRVRIFCLTFFYGVTTHGEVALCRFLFVEWFRRSRYVLLNSQIVENDALQPEITVGVQRMV